MLSLVAKFFDATRTYGLRRAVASTFQYIGNWWFDFVNKTETASWKELHELSISSDSVHAGSPYVPCKSGPLRKVLHSIGFPAGSVFLDFGCGKGKSLLVASEFDFNRVVGVEFSDELCEIARENFKRYPRKRPGVELEVLHLDAALYQFADDENLLFLYDPFGPDVLSEVFSRFHQSLSRRPRDAWVIYRAPEHRQVLDSQQFLNFHTSSIIGGAEYLLYHHAGNEVPQERELAV